ncbi:MAG: hypothetical protein HY815_15635 [Candidatus Riflebacteria bacterium]|nr:hypothetical protein [Candidatus Riflebacteria bacterium]
MDRHQRHRPEWSRSDRTVTTSFFLLVSMAVHSPPILAITNWWPFIVFLVSLANCSNSSAFTEMAYRWSSGFANSR